MAVEANDKIKFLKSLPLFNVLSFEDLTKVAGYMVEKSFEPGKNFIEEGTPPDNAYIIVNGSVRAYRISDDGGEITLNMLGEGDIVGEMSLIDGQLRSASVQALQKTVVLTIGRDNFIKILTDYPTVSFSLLKSLSLRVRANDERIEDILSKHLIDRTWKTLETLSSYFPEGNITLSQEELAAIIGATRARVTEVLNKLQAEGKISLSHRHIQIR